MSTIRKVKIFNKEYPLKGLATLLGVSLFLISCAIDFTYGKHNCIINFCLVVQFYFDNYSKLKYLYHIIFEAIWQELHL